MGFGPEAKASQATGANHLPGLVTTNQADGQEADAASTDDLRRGGAMYTPRLRSAQPVRSARARRKAAYARSIFSKHQGSAVLATSFPVPGTRNLPQYPRLYRSRTGVACSKPRRVMRIVDRRPKGLLSCPHYCGGCDQGYQRDV